MKNRMVNGKTLEQLDKELRACFPPDCIKKDNGADYPYIPAEYFHERMDRVVGPWNYDFTITDTRWFTIEEAVTVVNCIGTLSIKDDDGNVIVSKSAGGTDTINRNKTGKIVKPANDVKDAVQDAFKACCRMFGVGDVQLRELRKEYEEKKKKQKSYSNSNSNKSDDNPTEKRKVKFLSKLKSFSSSSGKFIGYKALVVDTDTGESFMLVVYGDTGVKEIEKTCKMNKFIEFYDNGRELTLFGYCQDRGNERQLIMKYPDKKGA